VAFIEWLAIAFWPITALAVVLAWRPMRRMWSARNNLFVVIAVLSIFALIIILTGVIGNQTAVSVFDVAVLFSLVGGSWLWLVVKVARRARILMTTLNLFLPWHFSLSAFCGWPTSYFRDARSRAPLIRSTKMSRAPDGTTTCSLTVGIILRRPTFSPA